MSGQLDALTDKQIEQQYGQDRKLLSLGPFKGLLTTPDTFYGDREHGVTCSGFIFSEKVGPLFSVKGRANIAAYTGTAENITSLARFHRDTVVPWSVYGTDKGRIGYMTDAGADAAFTLAVSLSNAKVAEFVEWGDYLFFCNTSEVSQKIKASDGSVTRTGIVKPSTTPTLAQGAAGVLDGTYSYRVTFQSATHESSPGPVSAVITVASKKVNLTAIPTSSDSQVTARNIYRLGGTSAIWAFVGTIADNTTTTATDNVADSAIGVELTLDRDPPPTTCKQFITHKNRLWGLTNTTLEPSNFNEPEGFNTGNSVKIDNSSSGDINQRVVSLGSLIVVGRRESCYAVYGENAGEFIPKRLLNLGLVAPLSLASDGTLAVGYFEDGVRAFDGSTWKVLSDPIKPTLDALSLANKEALCGEFHDKTYYLSSTGANKTWFFDFRTSEWGELPWGCGRIIAANGAQDPQTILGIRNDKDSLDKWFQGGMDNGNNLVFDWKTDRMILLEGYLFMITHVHVLMDGAGVPFTLTLTYDNARSDAWTLDPVNGELQTDLRCSDKAICHDLQIRINGSVTDNTKRLKVFKLWLYGWVEGRRK